MKLPSLSEVSADFQPLMFCYDGAQQGGKSSKIVFFYLVYLTIEAFILIVGAEMSEFPPLSRKLLVIQEKQREASRSFWSGMISVVNGGFTHLWRDCTALACLQF